MKNFFKKIVVSILGFCATYIYNKHRPYIVAVTGSSGKTTTKYMIGELLKGSDKDVAVSKSNLNSQYGLPLVMLGYEKSPVNFWGWIAVVFLAPIRAISMKKCKKIMVLEYASDRPGDLEYLTSIIPPDIAVITNIGVAHIEAFGSKEAIAREKWVLAQKARDKVICAKKVEEISKTLPPIKADLVVAGYSKTAQALNIKSHKGFMEFDLLLFGKLQKSLKLKMLGIHNVDNFLLSILCAWAVSGEGAKLLSKIEKIEPLEGRGQRLVSKNGAVIIDESYNANPASMIAAIGNLSNGSLGRRVIIMGEMKELGNISKKAHQEVALVAKKAADYCVGVGGGFEGLGLDKWYPNVEQLIKDIEEIIKGDDTVLIKGSHSVGLELAVKKIMEN
ncbi:MAG: UDP-N-acetylmuramoyl-tripeptide--D-alanyl-D-alanine ligase [candidate division WS2 bacterium ADurb.Bin280]|uniref:UDP-N-acetylmuramoyl-tripeptide--D-alanyl-D-alanine ligase n=1 Tax=candidate division WS2 bacterium ADurb.Bin280 TaxID=1852829 RepID=A0A1V5SFG7_9BACT|nr:MAG: UDP-N-acetylmuramoyl-tripeptide--D-alanyl-D-alanine ligase [candidate division WS2 bacterium ADurb.Bin280]